MQSGARSAHGMMLSKDVDDEASLDCVAERPSGLPFSTVLDVLRYRAAAPSAARQERAITFLRDAEGAETIAFETGPTRQERRGPHPGARRSGRSRPARVSALARLHR